MGDSITRGSPIRMEGAHVARLAAGAARRENPGRYLVGNFGKGGATLLPGTQRPYRDQPQYPASLEFAPDIVLIHLGINDSNHGYWDGDAEVFRASLLDLIQTYRELPSHPRIALARLTHMYPPHGKWQSSLVFRNTVNRVVNEVAAAQNLPVADFDGATLDCQKLFPDGLHPNTAGNARLARAAFRAILGKDAPQVRGLDPKPAQGDSRNLLEDVQSATWTQEGGSWRGTGPGNLIYAGHQIEKGDFHMRARLRMLGQEKCAAHFFLGENILGFEGASARLFRKGPAMGGDVRLLHPSPLLWDRDDWIDFEVIRNGDLVWFVIDGFVVEMAILQGPAGAFGFEPMRSRMEIAEWSLVGKTSPRRSQAPTLPWLDLNEQAERFVVVDREAGQYLGHVTTELLGDGKTILAVYPKGHGAGAICYKRSTDGGRTWSERLPTPASWATSREVPTLHRVFDPKTGKPRLILWSGLYPARLAHSEDEGATWSELEPAGDWAGIVVMGFVEPLKDGRLLAMFHDDGRFATQDDRRSNPVVFTLFQTTSADGGLTWSTPLPVWSGSDMHLCEPGCIRSPDGSTLAVLLRENSRRRNSQVIFSKDEGQTWTAPRELPADLTGDRHTPVSTPDGRIVISFRDTAAESPTQGDWMAWVGTWQDLEQGRPGQYRIRIKDNLDAWDCAYPGVEVLGDGTLVLTTYGHWSQGEEPYILSARFRLAEIDAMGR
ncbi:MAG: GDSL-type esterase/lipase family protein [Planctomycetota bacterium]